MSEDSQDLDHCDVRVREYSSCAYRNWAHWAGAASWRLWGAGFVDAAWGPSDLLNITSIIIRTGGAWGRAVALQYGYMGATVLQVIQ